MSILSTPLAVAEFSKYILGDGGDGVIDKEGRDPGDGADGEDGGALAGFVEDDFGAAVVGVFAFGE